ncbi:MAG: glycoside hydrolase family 27 protein [Clostridia bacterium]|nr:glycoside hydrolase family 27 protein [Clostridia bacterium]
MIAQRPPMGWNSWNTFGWQINDALIREMADYMVAEGYRDAGYEYLVIDDCWSLKQRGEDGRIVPDPEKFPSGMKAVADYVHAKGLKFGMYSCAGVRTCAGYPGSYDHEFVDAQTFADWGVDFLKYDFCNFPASGNCKARYLTMSMALKATGREILFSACNWGQQEPGQWMRQIGAHMYRSTGDIFDNFRSFTDIAKSQLDKLCMSGSYCFNDMDMLTVGMCGNGNVGIGKVCTYEEYRLQFSLWALCGVPLMMGADLRKLAPEYRELMQNKDLLRINQDIECRAPYVVRRDSVVVGNPDPQPGEPHWKHIPDSAYVLLRCLSDNEFALFFANMADKGSEVHVELADLGLPATGGVALEMRDVFTGETFSKVSDSFQPHIEGHDCKLYLCKLVKARG